MGLLPSPYIAYRYYHDSVCICGASYAWASSTELRISDVMPDPVADRFIKDVFLDSDTDLMVLSFVPSSREGEPLTIETTLAGRRFVSMSEAHLGGIEWTLTPHNWSGRVRFLSATTHQPDISVWELAQAERRRVLGWHIKDGFRNTAQTGTWVGGPPESGGAPYFQTFARTPTFTDAIVSGEGDLGAGPGPAHPNADPDCPGFKYMFENLGGQQRRYLIEFGHIQEQRVRRLRRKIDSPPLIHTVRHLGYTIRETP